MRLVFLCEDIPFPPDNGVRLKTFNVLKGLRDRGHVVTLLVVLSGQDKIEDRRKGIEASVRLERSLVIRSGAKSKISLWSRTLALRIPRSVARLQQVPQDAILALIRSNDVDVLQIDSINLAWFACSSPGVPVVISAADCASLRLARKGKAAGGLLKRARYLWDAHVMRRYEREVLPCAARCIFVSQSDALAAADVTPNLRASVIPNGVNPALLRQKQECVPHSETIVMTGDWISSENRDAAHFIATELMPELTSHVPNIQCLLVGSNANYLKRLHRAPGIIVTGYVEYLPDVLQRATLFVAPLRYGSGIKNKVLEAMACGLPVITTAIGVEGIEGAVPDAVMQSTLETFCDDTLSLMRNEKLRQKMGVRGQEYIKAHHRWGKIAEAYEMTYEDIGVPEGGAQ